MDMNEGKLQETLKDMGVWHAAVHGLQKMEHAFTTEQQQQMAAIGLRNFFLNNRTLTFQVKIIRTFWSTGYKNGFCLSAGMKTTFTSLHISIRTLRVIRYIINEQ